MTASNNRIAFWRKKRGLTQEQLAAALGVHLMTVSKLERGKMQLTAHWLEQIAPILQVKLEELMSIEAATYEVQVIGVIVDGMHVVDFAEGPVSQAVKDVAVNDLVSDWLIVGGRDLSHIIMTAT